MTWFDSRGQRSRSQQVVAKASTSMSKVSKSILVCHKLKQACSVTGSEGQTFVAVLKCFTKMGNWYAEISIFNLFVASCVCIYALPKNVFKTRMFMSLFGVDDIVGGVSCL